MKTIQKQQLIKFLGITLICLFCGTVGVFGQSYAQSSLMDKEWIYRIPDKPYITTFFFSGSEVTSKLFHTEKEDAHGEFIQPYYLSDEATSEFQHDLVGKNKSGKYIVMLLKEVAIAYEILELSDTAMKLKHVRSGNVMEYTIRES
jgi:hypothetical protein